MGKRAYQPAKTREEMRANETFHESQGLFLIKRNKDSILETDSFDHIVSYLKENRETKGKTYIYKDGLLIGQISKTGKIKNKDKEIINISDIPNKGVKDMSNLE